MKNIDRGKLLVAIVILMIAATVFGILFILIVVTIGILFILIVVTKGWMLAVVGVVFAVWMIYNNLDD